MRAWYHADRRHSSIVASTSGRSHDDNRLSDDEMADLCMLCAYGIDLAALTRHILQDQNAWPGMRPVPSTVAHCNIAKLVVSIFSFCLAAVVLSQACLITVGV